MSELSAISLFSGAGVSEPDLLTREQVQDVYDELEQLIGQRSRQDESDAA